MKIDKQINFDNRNSNTWFFFLPLILISIVSIGLLIACAWYFVDYEIAKELSKGLNSEFGKYWVRFYDQLGNTELLVIGIIYLTILLETWFLKKILIKNQKFKKRYWIVNYYYFIVIFGWIIFNIINIVLINFENTGFGQGIDFVLLDSNKYQLTGALLAFFYQTILLVLGLYYVRYHLIAKQLILVNQYWIKAIKAFSFFIITYGVIFILKWTTKHIYFYNVIFGDLINAKPDLLEIYKNSGFKYGFNNHGWWTDNIPWEFQSPWWKSAINIQANPNMPQFDLPWKYAFPSGHINATYCTGSIFLLFFNNKNNRKNNWKIKIAFIIWLLHVLSMNFALVVERFHWISDTAFTFIFSTTMIFIVNSTINKIIKFKTNKNQDRITELSWLFKFHFLFNI